MTGFLGSGKTTLVNSILRGTHGRRVAVIENEFGEVGVDDALLIPLESEELVELNNGCLCCTVRSDLLRILTKLLARPLPPQHVLIETTGLADPAPVASCFFLDEQLKQAYTLDAIVTVVDAVHVLPHLEEEKPDGVENECVEQVAFADRILLNKADLVAPEQLAALTARSQPLGRSRPSLPTRGVNNSLHTGGVSCTSAGRPREESAGGGAVCGVRRSGSGWASWGR